MSDQKKFGTFAGVFTPSILTILGVIMYLRLGWVVGNAGLWGTIGIIVIAHIISVTTGLSVSSIATDKKVGAGGVYYVLSRSLGLPIGGALGITLFVATAFSIALYMIGFAEIFNNVFDFGFIENDLGELVQTTNAKRITASVGLLILTVIALISTAVALKTQFIILVLIILSLIAIFFGDPTLASTKSLASEIEKVPFIEIFAIFFPAVTGFTAGVAMSGDLKDPKKSIPVGTMAAIAVGFIVYMVLALFLYFNFKPEVLITNDRLLYEITWFGGLFVIMGVWGATLSSALGGILGGPRILQAMSVDKITPKMFAKGVGKDNEPRNALILTVLIAEAGILIGELDVIAEIVSMFYLAAYGFINLSFFLESWASADFNPTFKVKKWVGLLGFIATFTVMFQLNMIAMVAAFVIIGGIYFYLNKKQITLGTGDIWQSVWSTVVKKGLRKMESGTDHKRNWKPNILLFSGGTENRSKLIEFSKAIAGQTGIITNFDLIENHEAKILFPKSKQRVKDEELEKFGIFGRQIEVQNEFKGIESIASTFGFSGIEPNTILMPWPGETKDPIWFTQMTKKLIDLDYNVLYLDYDKRWGFRKKELIDLWWRGFGNNAELMLSLVKFIKNSPDWINAKVRILLVNDTNTDNRLIEQKIKTILDQFRIEADIKIINNSVDQKPFYELMKIHSSKADLVMVGIPEIEEENSTDFVNKTNTLVNTIGTTLLVKASSQFDETDLKIEQINIKVANSNIEKVKITDLKPPVNDELKNEINKIDNQFDEIAKYISVSSAQRIENFHHKLITQNINKLDSFLHKLTDNAENFNLDKEIDTVLKDIRNNHKDACDFQLNDVYQIFKEEFNDYLKQKDSIIIETPKKVVLTKNIDLNKNISDKKCVINLKSKLEYLWLNKGLTDFKAALNEFGYQNYILLHQSKNVIHDALWHLIDNIHLGKDLKESAFECKTHLDNALKEIDKNSLNINEGFYKYIRNVDRNLLNDLTENIESQNLRKNIQTTFPKTDQKSLKELHHFIDNFPHFWKRNIILFTYHLQADLYLIQFNTRIEDAGEQLIFNTKKEFANAVKTNIEVIENKLLLLKDLVKTESSAEIQSFFIPINDDVYFSQEGLIKDLINNIQQAIDKLPKEVELMDAKSLNDIRNEQGDKVQTHQIHLDEVADYITKIKYIKPIQDEIAQYFNQLKRVMALILNASFTVSTQIENSTKNKNFIELEKSVNASISDINEGKELLNSVTEVYENEIHAIQKLLGNELDINKIIEQYDQLTQKVKSKQRSKSWQLIQNVKKKSIDGLQNFTKKIIHTKLDANTLKYKEQFESIENYKSKFLDFVDRVAPIPLISDKLPFYYQQLFLGKHISDAHALKARGTEISIIKKAITRINKGVNGAVLITGESMIGKSFLANHTVNHLIEGKVYRINLPKKISSDQTILGKIDMQTAFQNATGLNANINKIFNEIEPKSVFLIEDIEQWWLRTENGHIALDELNRIIEKFGNRHYFVLTANIFAFETIKSTTNIEDTLIETVILSPLNSNDLINILESRHHLGGLEFIYNGISERYMSEANQKKLFLKFYQSSDGNIGLALRQWIANIINVDEQQITISNDFNFNLPELKDDFWLSLLYQFILHKNLNRIELTLIYGEENRPLINRTLNAMLKIKLLKTIEKNTFEINPIVKPYIEKSLYA